MKPAACTDHKSHSSWSIHTRVEAQELRRLQASDPMEFPKVAVEEAGVQGQDSRPTEPSLCLSHFVNNSRIWMSLAQSEWVAGCAG